VFLLAVEGRSYTPRLPPRLLPGTNALHGPLLVFIALAAGCKNENGLAELRLDRVAVATGDFDYMEEVLYRLEIAHDPFEGFISQPVYDAELDGASIASKTEELFTGLNDDGEPLMYDYDAVLLNSGTRGFGAYVYNGVETDDSLVDNADAMADLGAVIERGRTLVVSDWAYESIEAAWPDRISFLNEADGHDAAQRGLSEAVTATVVDAELAEDLGTTTLALDFDFSYWTVIESVASDVTVHLQADEITYRISASEGEGTLQDVPLLVSFDAGNGRVLYSSFHWRAQNADMADRLIQAVVEGLVLGSANSTESGR
jgi:hypothetical protein